MSLLRPLLHNGNNTTSGCPRVRATNPLTPYPAIGAAPNHRVNLSRYGASAMAHRVSITDVAPRDGLQNEPALVPTTDKARLVQALCLTGVNEIEVSSFVSPKWVPQLGDAAELFELATPMKPPRVLFSALVPNHHGMARLLEINARSVDLGLPRSVDKVSVFTAASQTFSHRNTNAPISETLDRFQPVVAQAHDHGLLTRGYISCVIECPFEGPINPHAVCQVVQDLMDMGVNEIDLGDTIGKATPQTTRDLLKAVLQIAPAERLVLHLHDTYGHAAGCVRTALELGLRSFDGSAGGLGGCPYASTPNARAPGNISTRTLVQTIHEAGYTTSVDLDAIDTASAIAMEITQPPKAKP